MPRPHLMALSLHTHVTFYEDLTKNLALAGSTVALMELQADLDSMGQKILAKMPSFNQNRRKNHPNFLFGGYLTQLHYLDADRLENGCECPSFLKHLIDYLARHGIHEEGIFRIPGTKVRLQKLQEELTHLFVNYYKSGRPDNSEEIFELLSKYSIHDVASLLKLFLRQLAQPLLTSELVDIFLLVPSIPNLYAQIKILNLLMLTLNDTHRNSLCALLNLLNLVVQNEHYNKMTLDSMTTIMAPNLFVASHTITNHNSLLPGQSPALRQRLLQTRRMSLSSQTVNEISGEMAFHLERTNYQLQVLKLLINLQPILFHIPPYIYRQMKKS